MPPHGSLSFRILTFLLSLLFSIVAKVHITQTFLFQAFLSVRMGSVKYLHMACSDRHPHLQNSVILAQLTLCSLNTNAPSPCSPPAPGTHSSAFCLSGGPSCKWNPVRSCLFHSSPCPHAASVLYREVGSPSSSRLNKTPQSGETPILCTHSSVNGRVGCFHFFTTVGNVAANLSVQIPL